MLNFSVLDQKRFATDGGPTLNQHSVDVLNTDYFVFAGIHITLSLYRTM